MRIQILLLIVCGILSVKGSPVEVSNQDNDSKSSEVSDSLESNEDSSSEENSLEAANEVQTLSGLQANVVVETIAIIHGTPAVDDVSRKRGPVELSLRNVVAASAVATEEIYLQMTSMNAETIHMIHSKAEILTTDAMIELYQPLNRIENEIKRAGYCGEMYETARNMIFSDIEVNLQECNRNLSYIKDRYKNNNLGTLHSLSIAGEDINKLQESCELSQSFVAGTFCILNNLAEMNERVVADTNVIQQNTELAVGEIQSAIAASGVCQQALLRRVYKKLDNLSQEIDENCVKRKPKGTTNQ